MNDETKNNRTRTFFQSPGVRIALLIIIPTIIIAIIIVIVIFSKTESEEPSTTIDNISEVLPELPEETKEQIERQLYNKIKSTIGDKQEVPTSGAYIRTDSPNSFDINSSFYVGDFIVDIGSVHQSYIVKYFYGESPTKKQMELSASVQFYCVTDPDKIKYNDYNCQETSRFRRDNPIQYILPEYFPDNYFSLSYTISPSTPSGYAIIATCNPPESVYLSGDTDGFEREVRSITESYLENNGLHISDYELLFKYKIE